MALITTSLVVGFGEASDEAGNRIVKAEVDPREDGYNNGKTSGFTPGDSVGILLYKPDGSTVTRIKTSKGGVYKSGTTYREIEEDQQVDSTRDISVSYPVPSSFSYQWIGNNLSNVVRLNESALRLSKTEDQLGDLYAGVLRMSYNSPCDLYVLHNTLISGVGDYPILVVFEVEVP